MTPTTIPNPHAPYREALVKVGLQGWSVTRYVPGLDGTRLGAKPSGVQQSRDRELQIDAKIYKDTSFWQLASLCVSVYGSSSSYQGGGAQAATGMEFRHASCRGTEVVDLLAVAVLA
jgi:hypothetical protein